ncbi:MAG: UTP--glucose-1-phosphate uridylyltransferase, partial [Deltaproteobacteria bacterium]|nr:UTP--glucose-1-phosphate uridylyltransferase [Deltaproteobacteria bacterium]
MIINTKQILAMNEELEKFLNAAPPAHRKLFEDIAGLGMGGVFVKYLYKQKKEAFLKFFKDLSLVNLDFVKLHKTRLMAGAQEAIKFRDIEPIEFRHPQSRAELEAAGNESLNAGECAVLTFAGGSSTRFSSGKPEFAKGLFKILPVSGMNFLEYFACEMLETAISAGRMPVWLIMTSSATERPIKRWINNSHLSGFPKSAIIIFRQGENPRLDMDGDLIVDSDGSLILTGDGHGGAFNALAKKDLPVLSTLDELKKIGVKDISMHNVDNLFSRPCDPARIGFHRMHENLFTMSAVPRVNPDEKVGIFAYRNDRRCIDVIEYSVCPDEVKKAVDGRTGSLLFPLCHINSNIVSVGAMDHRIEPTIYTNKAVRVSDMEIASSSLEFLNQHLSRALPPERVGVYEVARGDFFLPTKNLKGEDSVETTQKTALRHWADVIEKCGGRVERDDAGEPLAAIELHPCLGRDLDDIRKTGIGRDWEIRKGARVFIGVRYGVDSEPFQPGLVMEEDSQLIITAELPYGRPRFP